MKLALVQGWPGTTAGLVVKLANTVDELLSIPFHFNPSTSPPRVYKVSDAAARDETGAALMHEIEHGKYRTLRIP